MVRVKSDKKIIKVQEISNSYYKHNENKIIFLGKLAKNILQKKIYSQNNRYYSVL